MQNVLIDAWAAAGGDPSALTLPSAHPRAPSEATELIDQRIDHIFVRPGQPGLQVDVESSGILGEPVNGLYPSDHYAVICQLAWTAPR